jgi:Mg2+ and Co2+ transporter CorA
MSDDTPNLVIEHLRSIRNELSEVRQEQREQRIRLGGIERGIVNLLSELTEMGLRLDRMHDRIDRIEQRLGLVEA